jgi:anti-sigma regulatory factor (Ser/Thr protein kinase)
VSALVGLTQARAGTREEPAPTVAGLTLAAVPSAVRCARVFVRACLRQGGLESLAEDSELVVSELVTNAIRYGADPIHVRVLFDRTLICEVFDSSSTSPHLRYAAMTDEGGRGLFLVAQLAERWGTRYTPAGKVIWAEQPLP